MKIALLYKPFKPEDTYEEKLARSGNNTGNLVYIYALQKIFSTGFVDIWKDDFSEYDTLIAVMFCWINENSPIPWLERFANKVKPSNIPIIPMTVGLSASHKKADFSLHPETSKYLAEIAERSVIGVRGYYTAEILYKHGIRNLQVIGCPSMYLHMDPHFVVRKDKTPQKPVVNFRTFWNKPGNIELSYLLYSANNNFPFIEQTQKYWDPHILPEYRTAKVSNWLMQKEKFFFDVDEWRKYMKQFNFSMGYRIHGNIVALWEGIPALFLTTDSRTEELCEYFRFPHMEASEFDATKPIEYYYERADYTEFNKHYSACYDEFCRFIEKNNLLI